MHGFKVVTNDYKCRDNVANRLEFQKYTEKHDSTWLNMLPNTGKTDKLKCDTKT